MKQPKERIQRVQAMLASFHSNAEIRAHLCEEYGISERQAYADIQTAQECSFHSEARERMHLGVIESMRERYRIAMSRTRTVTCPECKYEGAVTTAPNLNAAERVVSSMIKAFKLEITPEELLSDEQLREQILATWLGTLHMYSDDELATIRERIALINRTREHASDWPQ